MKSVRFTILGTALLALGAPFVHGQSIRPSYQFPAPPGPSGPASVQMAGSPFYFAPYVGLAVGHDDNVLLANTNTRSSGLYIVSPGFKIDARSTNSVFQLGYEARIGRYSSSEEDNYTDQGLRAQFDTAFDRRNFLRIGGDVLLGHDPRGSTDRPISTNPDKYRVTTPSAMYAFGAPGAAGRVELYYSDARKRYTNNRATTVLGDFGKQEFGGAFYVRVAPRTYAVVEARNDRIRYDQPSDHNGKERRYYGGIAWDATETTTGTIKVGRFQRNFDSSVPDYSDVGWEASINWAPRTYSRFEFYTSRFSTEASGLGNFIVSDATGVTWTHNWTSVLSSALDLKYQRDDYQGFSRKDDTMSLGVKVGYKFRRWLTLGAEYTYIKRDSTIDSSDYDKNLYFLTATASM
jgi:hypothetical protein